MSTLKRSPTTKAIDLMKQLYEGGQLQLAPEFQRHSVWPHAAKAYLIDTIINDRPIPLFFLQRTSSAQTGRPEYSIIDGQQRLRAIFEFMEGRFKLTQSDKKTPHFNKKYEELPVAIRDKILGYDLVVEELSGYTEENIEDIFVRMNKYVVRLSSQELRHAKAKGAFHKFVEKIGSLDFWRDNKVFSAVQLQRMRAVEFAAELSILLAEGEQDKKSAVDLYYVNYQTSFESERLVDKSLRAYLAWIKKALPQLAKTRFRSPTDLYSLIGALHLVAKNGDGLGALDAREKGDALNAFQASLLGDEPTKDALRYIQAASRQTDNIQPRRTRIEVIKKVLVPG